MDIADKQRVIELIEHHGECGFCDFKREEYPKEKHHELLKDILAFANSHEEGKKFIIIGIKEGDKKELIFHPLVSLKDSSTYQQLVASNISPELNIEYLPIEYNEATLACFVITPDRAERPYKAKKKFGKLNPNEHPPVRVGTTTRLASPDDYQKFESYRSRNESLYQQDTLFLGFQDGTQLLQLHHHHDPQRPSVIHKKHIKQILAEYQNGYREVNNIVTISNTQYEQVKNNFLHKPLHNDPQNYKNFSPAMLNDALAKIENNTSHLTSLDDEYIWNNLAHKLDFYCYNNARATEHLKDARIRIDIKGLKCRIGKYWNLSYGVGQSNRLAHNEEYKIKGTELVTKLQVVRHHEKTKITVTDPLHLFLPCSTKDSIIDLGYTIKAENLPEPISGNLQIIVT